MNRLTIGILAHVDAGKTTLCEAMLYTAGQLRKLGRVDHGDAFLDTDLQERARGITIFSKQMMLELPGCILQILDTPGHVDFSAEMERTLQVLDYAILLISGSDGVQSHTRTLWELLERYRVPTFLFINKMDMDGTSKQDLMAGLRQRIHENCVDFASDDWMESVSLCDEQAMEHYLQRGTLEDTIIRELIVKRKVFPCYFGSALRLNGVEQFMDSLERFTRMPAYSAPFGARVFKIARDAQGNRLSYLKITGGTLRARDVLSGQHGEEHWEEKVHQIRFYSGAKYQTVEEAAVGSICAVTGPVSTQAGDGLGTEDTTLLPMLEPVLSYELHLPEGVDPHSAWIKLTQLQEEDPMLHLTWQEEQQSIHLQLMGEVQKEILQVSIRNRFGWEVTFDNGRILYRETIQDTVEGIGHFEPLRHYAEVHLLLQPGTSGSGITVDSDCPQDVLALHWQRLIETHLTEREHRGVLTGAPITDVHVTILTGKAHEKHTEGGDFRQATYRALRHGLMQAKSVLLEPWYRFRLEIPQSTFGRAMTDLQRMNAVVDTPENWGDTAILTGSAPVAQLQGYASEMASYTRGEGHISCIVDGYRPCSGQEKITEDVGYDPERDKDNPADSVFCIHGAASIVPWYEVERYAHLPTMKQRAKLEEAERPVVRNVSTAAPSFEQDKELQKIFERTYGVGKSRSFLPKQELQRREDPILHKEIEIREETPEYLLVDGYNIIFAWDELKETAQVNLEAARTGLLELMCNYQGYRGCRMIVVFDAYKVSKKEETVLKYRNITVVYTKERQTADAYIEKATYEIGKEHRVRVATSDGAEQMIILGHGALRVSADSFREEVQQTQGEIRSILEQNNRENKQKSMEIAMKKAERRGTTGN